MSRAFDIDTTSPSAVAEEAKAIFDRMGFGQSGSLIRRLFDDVPRLFAGGFSGYQAIDMRYHNFEHTLQATVCAFRIVDGRHAIQIQPLLGRRDCELLLAAVLLHDTGFLKRTGDDDGTGAKYTFVHERRSCEFATTYLPSLGFSGDEINAVNSAISCTGPRNTLSSVQFKRPEIRTLTTILVTADYLSQMASADYVDKLPVLYQEFEEAYCHDAIPESDRPFRSADDLIHKTPAFWEKFVRPMLDRDLDGVYSYIASAPPGANPFIADVGRNISRIYALTSAPHISLDPFPSPDRSIKPAPRIIVIQPTGASPSSCRVAAAAPHNSPS
jgi:hypothetical protein